MNNLYELGKKAQAGDYASLMKIIEGKKKLI